ncbi:peroxiredoxin [Fusibacter bizertensis]|uniref:thioredoxin-dependent peroxiredoxin n=1 Tax=Fusibacter bizertensis TaxID=1488331 RepID=A0ABT6NFG9_9FIRM|nr:peroxiredoxin [Fusibacter bizertensis]MDH8679156.1 peroxiredoxin [Fusibacter bizertensis]
MNYLSKDFKLPTTGGKEVTIESLMKQNFVLYFYPKDNTSACTTEALEFAELYDDFRALGFHVYGISKDTIGSHEKFKEKFSLPYTLISDVEKVLLEQFNVIKDKKMYGKAVKGTVRSTFVFCEGLKLVKEFRDVKAIGHAKAVLDFLEDFTPSN